MICTGSMAPPSTCCATWATPGKAQGSRVLLLGTARSEGLELNPELAAQLLDLGRDLPLTQLPLPPLSQAETFELLEALAGEKPRPGPALSSRERAFA